MGSNLRKVKLKCGYNFRSKASVNHYHTIFFGKNELEGVEWATETWRFTEASVWQNSALTTQKREILG